MAKKVTIDIINDEFLWKIFAEVQAAFEQVSKEYVRAIKKQKGFIQLHQTHSPLKKVKNIYVNEVTGGLKVYKDANTQLIAVLGGVIRQIENQQAKVTQATYWEAPRE